MALRFGRALFGYRVALGPEARGGANDGSTALPESKSPSCER